MVLGSSLIHLYRTSRIGFRTDRREKFPANPPMRIFRGPRFRRASLLQPKKPRLP